MSKMSVKGKIKDKKGKEKFASYDKMIYLCTENRTK